MAEQFQSPERLPVLLHFTNVIEALSNYCKLRTVGSGWMRLGGQ